MKRTPRKTLPVSNLVTEINQALTVPDNLVRLDPDLTPEQVWRLALATVLESVLMQTDNYMGFRYQSSQWNQADGHLRDDYDPTRRIYL